MRKFVLILSCLVPLISSGQSAKMSFQVKVINDAGEPIPDCEVVIRTFDRWVPGTGFGKDYFNIRKLETDEEGIVRGSATSKADYLYYAAISPDGYYDTVQTRFEYSHQEDGKWQPDNQKFEVVLKRIKNPIPMYAKDVDQLMRQTFPGIARDCAFDFEIGDWVAPHGQGKIEDIVFHVEIEREEEGNYRRKIRVFFVRKMDGLVRFEKEMNTGSRLRSDYQAPKEGYLNSISLVRTKVGHTITDSRNRNANYYFRVRTELDENGNLISANYGKIHGDFMYFIYYFNPTPNDRNLEFDPERNLFLGERVVSP